MNIINELNVTNLTKQNYKYKLKKVMDYGINWQSNETDILNSLNKLKDTFNNISSYLNVIIVLRKYSGLSIDELVYFRDERRMQNENNETETNMKNKLIGMPSLQDLIQYTKDLYENDEYKKYIINYLLLATNCRNADLDLIITDEPVDGNYLLIKNNKCIFVRNDYKTSETYGTKQNTIEEPSFIYSCKKLGYGPLLTSVNKNQEIRNCTYNKLGQGRYFKIITGESDIKDLKKLSNNRGTAISTIIDFYHIN